MKKLYCPVCRKEVFYKIEKRNTHVNDFDIPFDYEEKVAICNICGEELYSDELEKDNQNSYEDSYIKENDIITIEEIKEIFNKYDVGKRVLPYILGIGELTITRYLDGYIPTRKISILLKEILYNPEIYKEYLEKNKNLIRPSAYLKTSKKVNSLLDKKYFDIQDEVSNIINELTNIRINHNLSIKDLSNKAGISEDILSQIEKFEIIPRLDMLIKISNALDLKFEVKDRYYDGLSSKSNSRSNLLLSEDEDDIPSLTKEKGKHLFIKKVAKKEEVTVKGIKLIVDQIYYYDEENDIYYDDVELGNENLRRIRNAYENYLFSNNDIKKNKN